MARRPRLVGPNCQVPEVRNLAVVAAAPGWLVVEVAETCMGVETEMADAGVEVETVS